jgi:two-component system nitrogen regulation sensor histidine kinase NtrY
MRPHAAGEGMGRIGVDVMVAGDAVSIRVTDDGVGLPDQDLGRLTEPYVTHKPKGTGLGLAIVKKIMEDHGGRVSLEDCPAGHGAIATLTLPLTRDGREADAA